MPLICMTWFQLISDLGPLEWIFNTPKHHRVHHGEVILHTSFCFPAWDGRESLDVGGEAEKMTAALFLYGYLRFMAALLCAEWWNSVVGGKTERKHPRPKKRGIRGHRFGLKSAWMSSHQILSQQGGTITALTRIMGEFWSSGTDCSVSKAADRGAGVARFIAGSIDSVEPAGRV